MSAKLWTDNMEVVTKYKKGDIKLLPSNTTGRNVDMWLQIKELRKQYNGSLEVIHAKGHQDDYKSYDQLSFESKRNVDCDKEAKDRVRRMDSGGKCIHEFPRETEVMLWTEAGGLTEDPYNWKMEDDAKAIVEKRLRLGRQVFEKIDWDLHGNILRKMDPGFRPGVQKILWREHPTTVKMHRDRQVESSECPLCSETDGPEHYLECSELCNTNEKSRLVGNLRHKMRGRGTNPFLANWIMVVLGGKTPVLESLQPLRLHQRVKLQFERQAQVGWEELTNGRVAKGMEGLQSWWEDYRYGKAREVRRDPRETVAQTLTYSLLCKYELWKLRCNVVVEKALPVEERILWGEVEKLRGKKYEVGARDRGLFLERNIPKKKDAKEKLKEWVRSVTGSMARFAEKERRSHRGIGRL